MRIGAGEYSGSSGWNAQVAWLAISLTLCVSVTSSAEISSVVSTYDSAVVRFEVSCTSSCSVSTGWTFQLFIDSDQNDSTGYGRGYDLVVRGVESAAPADPPGTAIQSDAGLIYVRRTAGDIGPGGWGEEVASVSFEIIDGQRLSLQVPVGVGWLADGHFRFAFEFYLDEGVVDGVYDAWTGRTYFGNAGLEGEEAGDWLDTGAQSSLEEDDSLFKLISVDGTKAIATQSSATDIHSHYVGRGSESWTYYQFTGRMMITDAEMGIGVTFFSDYPNSNTYYRLRRLSNGTFHIAPHPWEIVTISGGNSETAVNPVPGEWYRFKIEVEPDAAATNIRAKVWNEATDEPAAWQANCYDDHENRLVAGTIGVWSMHAGVKFWDHLKVAMLGCGQEASAADACACRVIGIELDEAAPIVTLKGDADGNGTFDLNDFTALLECFGGSDRAPRPSFMALTTACLDLFDYDGDGDVDDGDASNWLPCLTGP